MQKMKTNLDYALLYHNLGFSVVPVTTVSKSGECSCLAGVDCQSAGKHPAIKWKTGEKNYQAEKATIQEIQEWWTRNPAANVGIVTGAVSGIIVLDIDGTKGVATLREEELHVPPTVVAKTGGGGWHYFYRHPGFTCRNFAGKTGQTILPGVDFRGDGGFIVAPPSVHRSGGRYEWALNPSENTIADAPEWLLEAIKAQAIPTGNKIHSEDWEREIPIGERNTTLAKFAGSLISRNGIPISQIVEMIFAVNTKNCKPPLSRDEVETIVLSIAKVHERNNPPVREDEQFRFTDLGNAKRLVATHGDNMRYCHDWGTWLLWDGKKWIRDSSGGAERLAKSTIAALYEEAARMQDEDKRTTLIKHALRSESQRAIQAMLALATSEQGIPIQPGLMDADPWLLNCTNGTINLKTGELLPHSRNDFLTKMVGVAYDKNANSPLWLKFLNRIMDGNQNLIRFLQKAIGYSLTGDVGEQVFFVNFGHGANGKTVLLRTLLSLLSDYGKTVDPELLLAKTGDSHPTGRADLMGTRLAVALESEEGRRLNESLVKWLTGGDKLKARFMRQDFFEFSPTHKIWFSTNHRPVIRGTDNAIWRRIRLIPFSVTIPPEERDRNLCEKLSGELSGILNWAVEGCLAWQSEGLGEPDEVRKATDTYRADMDLIGEFINATCILSSASEVRASSLYQRYQTWCTENGEHPLAQRNFGIRLTERGFIRQRRSGGFHIWHGINILD